MEACGAACANHGSLEFYPPKVWGLDFHFNSFRKMYVTDILHMKEYPHFTGAFAYKNHPVYKVDVMGTVVKRVEQSKFFLYAVDDGTGVILCCVWKDSFDKKYGAPLQKENLPEALTTKLSELETAEEEVRQGYSLGDYIHVKGKIKVFREKKEIVAAFHSIPLRHNS